MEHMEQVEEFGFMSPALTSYRKKHHRHFAIGYSGHHNSNQVFGNPRLYFEALETIKRGFSSEVQNESLYCVRLSSVGICLQTQIHTDQSVKISNPIIGSYPIDLHRKPVSRRDNAAYEGLRSTPHSIIDSIQ